MTHPFFANQVQRLVVRFGSKAFDAEFIKLIWKTVAQMSERSFERFVDVQIGTRPHTRPPLLTDFREAHLTEESRKFHADVRGAADFLERRAPEAMRDQLKGILSREYGAVDGIKEAFEVAKIRHLTTPKGEN